MTSHPSGASVLPVRSGARPKTEEPAHRQLDQPGSPLLQVEFVRRLKKLHGVRLGSSVTPAPTSHALHLDADLARGPADAFITETEFAHLHEDETGSLHMSLQSEIRQEAIDKGWAETHPGSKMGFVPATVVLVYGPRDNAELEVVWGLVSSSYAYARGQ